MDLRNEQDLREGGVGCVPNRSCVSVKITPKAPIGEYGVQGLPLAGHTLNGMFYVNCQFEVTHGRHAGSKFFQSINLPLSMQRNSLSEGQQVACRIGGSQLKAIALFCNLDLANFHLEMLNGCVVPVRVKVVQNERDGKRYNNNQFTHIFAKDSDVVADMSANGYELITDEPLPPTNNPQVQPHGDDSNDINESDVPF